MDYRKSHLDPGKGESYHRSFVTNPYRKMVWECEKEVLSKVIRELFPGGVRKHLDFACGTGRILSFLEPYTDSSTGVDVSPSMIQVARKVCSKSRIVEADLTKEDALEGRMFDLITAFRFFANAQQELRDEAMQCLVRHLDPSGYLICNNHRNSGSLLAKLVRIARGTDQHYMSCAEVDAQVATAGLKVIRAYSLCIFPASERKTFLPVYVIKHIDKLLSKWRIFAKLGANVIYVCQKI